MIDNLQKIAEILTNVITPIAIIIGGLWAYRRFRVRNEGQWNANLSVNIEIINAKIDEKLVCVTIVIDNIGYKKITPTINGLTVNLFKASSQLPDFCIIDDWVEVKEISKDILTVYKNETAVDYSAVWNLDSGAIYTERIMLKIKDSGLYRIKCKLHIVDKKMPDKENWLTEYTYFQL